MKKFELKGTNAIQPAAPASVWGKGCPGKGKPVKNAVIDRTAEKTEKEND